MVPLFCVEVSRSEEGGNRGIPEEFVVAEFPRKN